MTTVRRSLPAIWHALCRNLVFDRLARLERGYLQVSLPDGSTRMFGVPDTGRDARLVIHDDAFFAHIVRAGDVGLGEAYVEGLWDSPDVPALFAVLIENRAHLADGGFWLTTYARWRDRLRHLLRDNNIRGSRRNIYEHYDLGNDFYRTFLDASMMYSCALYQAPGETLEQAQKNKLQAIIEKLDLGPDDHVLEIGCGWGGFALEAVRQTGCRVTGVTISPAQQQWAQAQVRQAGLEDRIEIRLQDYRQIEGRFDRIVSIEMLEAVGHRWLKGYFYCCDRLLKPGGRMVLQTITIPCAMYDYHRRGTDWIRKHIFPGGHLPSLGAIRDAIAGQTALAIHDLQEIGLHYAHTLREWRQRFTAQLPTLEKFGLDRHFQRKWHYYLATCESGFATRSTGTLQIILTKQP